MKGNQQWWSVECRTAQMFLKDTSPCRGGQCQAQQQAAQGTLLCSPTTNSTTAQPTCSYRGWHSSAGRGASDSVLKLSIESATWKWKTTAATVCQCATLQWKWGTSFVVIKKIWLTISLEITKQCCALGLYLLEDTLLQPLMCCLLQQLAAAA